MYIGITYELNDSKRVGEALVNIKKVANKNLTPEQYDEYKKEARILLAKRLSTEISNIIPKITINKSNNIFISFSNILFSFIVTPDL